MREGAAGFAAFLDRMNNSISPGAIAGAVTRRVGLISVGVAFVMSGTLTWSGDVLAFDTVFDRYGYLPLFTQDPSNSRSVDLANAVRVRLAVHALESERNDLEDQRYTLSFLTGLNAGFETLYLSLRIAEVNHTIRILTEIGRRDWNQGDPLIARITGMDDPNNDIVGTGLATDENGDPIVSGWGYRGQNNSGDIHAFRWTLQGGTVDLGTLQGPNTGNSFGYALSENATIVVGESTVGGGVNHAFRWTQALGMRDLQLGGADDSAAYSVSADGSAVVGFDDEPDFFLTLRPHAFRWVLTDPLTGAGVKTSLGTLPGGNSSTAYAVSADGNFVAGTSFIAGNNYHPFLWSVGTGMTDLGLPAGKSVGVATAMSADGAVVVGIANLGGGSDNVNRGIQGWTFSDNARAFRWTAATGTADLGELMSASGVDMSGITLLSATTVTADGQYIGGNAFFPGLQHGEERGYMLRYCDATVAEACIAASIGGFIDMKNASGSLDSVAAQYHAASAQLGGTADLLLGLGQPIETPDSFGALAAVGSVTLGANGHWNLDKGFSLNAGAGLVEQAAGGVTTTGALFGASVRYVHSVPIGDTGLTPFAEAGAWGSPNLSMTFSRSYANGAGTATGTGTAAGSIFGLFAKAGVLYAPTPDDDVVFSATIAHNWLNVGGYTEALSAANPFPATFAAAASQTSQIKAGVDWTHAITPQLDFTLSAAIGSSFGSTSTASATVAGLGTVTGTAGDYGFGQLGARLSYKVSDKIDIEGFVVSTFGNQIGTHTQIGGGLHVSF